MSLSDYTGWRHLIVFIVRRDRLRIGLWLLGLIGVTVASASALPATYPDQVSIDQYADLFGSNPALVAFAGPGYGFGDPNLGVILVNEIQVFAFIGIALMSIFLVVHGTRAEEDSERADLVRSSVVGRHAPTAAVVAVVAVVALIVGVLSGVGFLAAGYAATGSFALAASMIAVGWLFAAVAVVAAQVMSTARGALGAAGATLGVSFIVRAVGDIGEGWASWLSPLGWAQAVRAFADERWWTLGLCLGFTAALGVVGLWLANHRDLGAGLIPARLGRREASRRDTTPLGFALRLHRGSIIAWALGMFVTGVVFGSLAADIGQMVEENPTFADVFVQTDAGIVDSYLATTASMLALVATAFAVAAVLRPRSEESAGHAEPILATRTSRRRWLGAHLLVALAGTVVVVAAGGIGAGATAAIVLGDAGELLRIVGAAMVTLPAIFVVIGAALALYGAVPRIALAAWGMVGFMAVAGYLGRALRFPDWLLDLSPMNHVPQVPAVGLDAAPLVVMGVVAAVLMVVGIVVFDRRDVAAT